MEEFGIGWKDETGLFIQMIYWIKNGRCFVRMIDGGYARKARRISEAEYMRAYEQYKNY